MALACGIGLWHWLEALGLWH